MILSSSVLPDNSVWKPNSFIRDGTRNIFPSSPHWLHLPPLFPPTSGSRLAQEYPIVISLSLCAPSQGLLWSSLSACLFSGWPLMIQLCFPLPHLWSQCPLWAHTALWEFLCQSSGCTVWPRSLPIRQWPESRALGAAILRSRAWLRAWNRLWRHKLSFPADLITKMWGSQVPKAE